MVDTPQTFASLNNLFRDGQNQAITAKFVRQLMLSAVALASPSGTGSQQATAFLPVGHTFGFLVGGNPAPISTYFASVAAANTYFGSTVCTATTNYTDWCTVKAALNAAVAGGTVFLPAYTTIYADSTASFDGSLVSMQGSIGTIIRTFTCGSNPAISVNATSAGTLGTKTPLSNITFYAVNSGGGGFPQSGNGVANTGYTAGSSALQINGTPGGFFQNLTFNNYDNPHAWTGSNVYLTTFVNCVYNGNNKGPSISLTLTNSFEGMRWIGGGSFNNNYGFYFSLLDGGGNPGAGSIYIRDMSVDYNIVRTGYYDGLGATANDCQIPLNLAGLHCETDSTTSGTTVARFYNNGNMMLSEVNGYENGANPVGWIEPGARGRTSPNVCLIPGTGLVTAVYTTAASAFVSGSGNFNRYGGDVLLARTSIGDLMGEPNYSQRYLSKSGSFTLALADQKYSQILTAAGGTGTATIPQDATANHVIGTKIALETGDTSLWTVAATGSAVVTPAFGLSRSFGLRAGAAATIEKTAANTWVMYGTGVLRAETSRTNIALDGAFQASGWGTTNITLTQNNVLSPSGLVDGAMMAEGTVTGAHTLYQNQTIAAGATIASAVFLKQGTGRYIAIIMYDSGNAFAATIDLQTGLITQSGVLGTGILLASRVEAPISGWFRVGIIGSIPVSTAPFFLIESVNTGTPASQGYNLSYTGTSLYNYVWGAQEEAGSFSTSYIPSGVTRP